VISAAQFINFAHGAVTWRARSSRGSLLPHTSASTTGRAESSRRLVVGAVGVVLERTAQRLYGSNRVQPALTFGIALMPPGPVPAQRSARSGEPYEITDALRGAKD